MKEIYLDNAASAPLLKEVKEEIINTLELIGNPSSFHSLGKKNLKIIYKTRKIIADFLKTKEKEVFFTSSGTESNNFILQNLVKKTKGSKILTSIMEHSSVKKILIKLAKENNKEIIKAPLLTNGELDLENFKKQIKEEDIAFVSIVGIDGETGIINNIEKIAEELNILDIPLHVDAVQFISSKKINLQENNITALSFSGHKLGALKGVGGMYLNSNFKWNSLIYGENHESNMQAGTENVLGIATLGKAFEILDRDLEERNVKYQEFNDYILKYLEKEGINFKKNGIKTASNILSLFFPDIKNNILLVTQLDLKKCFVSFGTACTSNSTTSSELLKYLKTDGKTIRISFGCENTLAEIKKFLNILITILSRK